MVKRKRVKGQCEAKRSLPEGEGSIKKANPKGIGRLPSIKVGPKAKRKTTPKLKRARIVKKVVKRIKPLKARKPKAVSRKPEVRAAEAIVKQQELVEEARQELPHGYGDNRIVLMVRDPYWAYTYWEITDNKKGEIAGKFGIGWDRLAKVLRVYDVTNIIFNGTNANSYFDIEAGDYAATWYINVGRPDTSWCVDIGVKTPSGEFIMIARSNCITTPRDTASWVTDEEWMIVEEDFRKLYALSGGLRVGLSSAGLKEAMKERLRFELASGAVSSISSPSRKAGEKKGFWLIVNTELIVYGATEPNAKLTVQGRPVRLNRDGTFSLRYALPDGMQVIPVKAVPYDGSGERTITPIVTRKTE